MKQSFILFTLILMTSKTFACPNLEGQYEIYAENGITNELYLYEVLTIEEHAASNEGNDKFDIVMTRELQDDIYNDGIRNM